MWWFVCSSACLCVVGVFVWLGIGCLLAILFDVAYLACLVWFVCVLVDALACLANRLGLVWLAVFLLLHVFCVFV